MNDVTYIEHQCNIVSFSMVVRMGGCFNGCSKFCYLVTSINYWRISSYIYYYINAIFSLLLIVNYNKLPKIHNYVNREQTAYKNHERAILGMTSQDVTCCSLFPIWLSWWCIILDENHTKHIERKRRCSANYFKNTSNELFRLHLALGRWEY